MAVLEIRSSGVSLFPADDSLVEPRLPIDAMSRLVTAGRDRLREVPILSLFTGGGFLDLGFHSTGAEIVWRNEYHKPFADAFRFALEGMGRGADSDVNTSSIVDLGPTDILREAFGRSGRPSTFGMIGGPPCPDFSVGGKNRGSSGERGQLTQVFVNRVLELRPSFFVMENVPGLTRTAKHRAFLDLQRLKLEQHYVTSLQILNALDFGTPQDRERVFFVGFNRKWLKAKKVDPIQGFHFDWPIDARFHGAKSRYEWPKVAMPGEEVRRPAEIPSELFVATHILDLALDSDIPNAREHFRPKSGKFLKIREGDDSRKSFKRLHRWRYSPTVAYGNNEVHLHPIEPRRLSVREALRLQTVPDDYALPPDMPLSHKFKMVGNGVPINLARAVATAVMSALLRVENDQDV